jgi:hypothetical protein
MFFLRTNLVPPPPSLVTLSPEGQNSFQIRKNHDLPVYQELLNFI